MKVRYLLITLLSVLTSTAWAGDVVGNGGQIVMCGAPVGAEVGSQPEAGIYSLDYIQFRDAYDYQPVSSLDDSFDRIEELLVLMPTVLKSFQEYRRQIKNQNFNLGNRIWTLSDLELKEIDDTETLRLLPMNCRHQNPGDPYGAFQMIVRRPVGEMIFYEAYRPYLSKIEENPLQASLLYVHEWLWDFAKDAYQSRRANVYMHSIHADADELATLFVRAHLIDAKSRNPKEAPVVVKPKAQVTNDNTQNDQIQPPPAKVYIPPKVEQPRALAHDAFGAPLYAGDSVRMFRRGIIFINIFYEPHPTLKNVFSASWWNPGKTATISYFGSGHYDIRRDKNPMIGARSTYYQNYIVYEFPDPFGVAHSKQFIINPADVVKIH